ncbi:hypothetical protein CC86DRAFT_181959 [Ophiobolus disseminans]|uniref:F-box domain-containing protein n=1 Tax=Ophiobolus disseminans TaxID=1469910 RepID=A0A6A7ABG1_9PLEO|nr:hypothetical protein CC86DRAFT_181959 [Ophiobolus disseminans]
MMDSPSTIDPLPPLLCLPVELHLEICDHLQGDSSDLTDDGPFELMRLRLVNQYFHSLVPAVDHTKLLHLEDTSFAQRNDLYACKHCLRLRKGSQFSDRRIPVNAKMTVKRQRGGLESRERFCADCGFADQNEYVGYAIGKDVTVDGVRWVWCTFCRKVKKGDEAGDKRCHDACRACLTRLRSRRLAPYVKVEMPGDNP